jgi:mannose-6-phosphate isomerase-like protein (cupin superfamily)
MKGYVGPIEKLTEDNTNFRQVIHTSGKQQLVVMSLLPGEDIGKEVHPDVDQFFRIEEGEGKVIMNGEETPFKSGDAIIVPAGVEHNVLNTSDSVTLKLYTIYSPPNHPEGTVHKTREEAMEAEKAEHGK